eukprot:jgi/Mesen1/8816/ME000053S08224
MEAETSSLIPRAKLFIIIFIGLPGAGKSTLARALQKQGQDSVSNGADLDVFHVCFDDFSQPTSDVVKFSGARHQPGASFSPEVWKAGRQEALAAVERLLLQHSSLTGTSSASGRQVALLLDDTMHLRSMRYDIVQLARQYGAAYAILHVRVGDDVARARNGARGKMERVPEAVFDRLLAALEAPQPAKWHWERPLVELLPDAAAGDFDVRSLWALLLEQWGAPPAKLASAETLAAQRAAGAAANAASVCHALDLRTRQLVAQALSSARSFQSGDAACQTAFSRATRVLSSARKDMLARVRALTHARPAVEKNKLRAPSVILRAWH